MDVISAVLTSPITLMALGVVVKFFPGVREIIANRLIPTLNIAVALIGSLIALATGAAGAPVPVDAVPGAVVTALNDFNHQFVTAGFFSFLGGEARGLMGAVGGALGSAAQAYLLNRLTLNEWFKTPANSRR